MVESGTFLLLEEVEFGDVLVSLALEVLDELDVVGVLLVLIQEGSFVVHEVLVGEFFGAPDLDVAEVDVVHLVHEGYFGKEALGFLDRGDVTHNISIIVITTWLLYSIIGM